MPKVLKKQLFNQRGITLIELIAVILIIGIIAAVGIPVVFNQIQNAEEEADNANAAIVTGAIERYALLNGEYPSALTWDTLKATLTSDSVKGGPYLRDDFPDKTKTTEENWILRGENGTVIATTAAPVYTVTVD